MDPTQAARLCKHARRLLRRGVLTHRQLALLDCLVWSCRRPGAAQAEVSYTRLQSLAHISREVVGKGVHRLAELGLLTIIKSRVRCGWASRQATNIYRFATESAPATVISVHRIIERIEAPPALVAAARRSLEEVAERRRRELGLARPRPRG